MRRNLLRLPFLLEQLFFGFNLKLLFKRLYGGESRDDRMRLKLLQLPKKLCERRQLVLFGADLVLRLGTGSNLKLQRLQRNNALFLPGLLEHLLKRFDLRLLFFKPEQGFHRHNRMRKHLL